MALKAEESLEINELHELNNKLKKEIEEKEKEVKIKR